MRNENLSVDQFLESAIEPDALMICCLVDVESLVIVYTTMSIEDLIDERKEFELSYPGREFRYVFLPVTIEDLAMYQNWIYNN